MAHPVQFRSLLLAIAVALAVSGLAREIHVAKAGTDSGAGTAVAPLLTIQRAAEMAQPGDEVIVHAGTYREWVRPVRSGTPDRRIVFRAATGERVRVKGSEVARDWERVHGNLWRAVVPNTVFGDYNPYALTVEDIWMGRGQAHTRGQLYVDGEAFTEGLDLDWDVVGKPAHWHSRVDSSVGTTTIFANFRGRDPNTLSCEINVRKHVIAPEAWNLGYVTIRGFEVEHAANTFGLFDQGGAISTKMGLAWVIEDCTVSHARTVGIDIGWYSYPDASVWDIFDPAVLNAGKPAGLNVADASQYGHHIVRRNTVRDCGAIGIYGTFAPFCTVEYNLVEDINTRDEFVGHETAGIKTHNANDAVFRGNVVRHVVNGQGMWLDWGNQGARVTQNVFIDCGRRCEFEVMKGPVLIDNNVYIDCNELKLTGSSWQVFAHNLFVNTPFVFERAYGRTPNVFAPHSTKTVTRVDGEVTDNWWLGNVFVGAGLTVPTDSAYFRDNRSRHNLYLGGARPSAIDLAPRTMPNATVQVVSTRDEIKLIVDLPEAPAAIPVVTQAAVGENPFSGELIRAAVDADYGSAARAEGSNAAGPLAELQAGRTEVLLWKRK